jgi:hypothetical protein
LLVELDKAGELRTVARVAELTDVLGVGVERDQSNDVGGVVVACGGLTTALVDANIAHLSILIPAAPRGKGERRPTVLNPPERR